MHVDLHTGLYRAIITVMWEENINTITFIYNIIFVTASILYIVLAVLLLS